MHAKQVYGPVCLDVIGVVDLAITMTMLVVNVDLFVGKGYPNGTWS